jgi:methyl-accepting chemotaxis protein
MNMKISTKLALGFAAMLLLVIVTAVAGIMSLNRIGASTADMAKQADQSAALGSIHAGAMLAESTLLAAFEDPTMVSLMNAKVVVQNVNDEVTAFEHPMKPADLTVAQWSAAHPEATQSCAAHCHEGPQILTLEEKRAAFTKVMEEYLAEAEKRTIGMTTAQYTIGAATNELLMATDSMALAQVGTLARVKGLVAQVESYTRTLMIVSSIVAAILGIVLAITITRNITVPLAKLVKVSDMISTGELDTPVPVAAKDEIGELAEAMERMRISVRALVERLRSRSSG